MKWLLLALPALLSAEEICVESDHVTYRGGELHLQGHVSVDHPLAHISAGEATFEPTSDQQLRQFELHEGVTVTFTDGGELHCTHAYVDAKRRLGRFLEQVHYTDCPITIGCRRMDVQMTEIGEVEHLEATGSVNIEHSQSFHAQASGARYLKTDFPQELLERCEPTDLLILQHAITLQARKLGELTTDEQVQLVRTLIDGKAEIDSISATGHLTLTDGEHLLQCCGELFVDHLTSTALLQSADGVLYRDRLGGFTAESITLEYNEAFEPTRIALLGNVRIQSQTDLTENLQYAIADEVEYLPPSETMTLRAHDKGRVLFLDQGEDTRISAKEVVINRKDRSIEGVGNVRFSLSQPEMNRLQELFAFEN